MCNFQLKNRQEHTNLESNNLTLSTLTMLVLIYQRQGIRGEKKISILCFSQSKAVARSN